MQTEPRKRIRYAVAGLGWFAQTAVLPAFAHAEENSELVALVSGDSQKRDRLGRQYGARFTYPYDALEDCLENDEVDAIYITLPNSLHADVAVRALRAGVHVLCEKPMALSETECRRMIRAGARGSARLMVGYRLHFERANLEAIRQIQTGAIGRVRLFDSVFVSPVREPNIRLDPRVGGGPLFDLGIYCVNAARYLFRAEPIEVSAFAANGDPERFAGVDEMLGGLLRFPGNGLASFICSFGAHELSTYRIVGTRGDLRVEPAYDFATGLSHHLGIDGRRQEREFPKCDQVAGEILYFSDCIRREVDPEPSGLEGLADVRVLRALERSARTGRRVKLSPFDVPSRPSIDQVVECPPSAEPELFHARPPSESLPG